MNLRKPRTKTSTTSPPSLTEYPQGTYLETETGYYYVYSPVKRYRFSTKRVLDSWNPIRVIKANESDLAVQKLKVVAKMKFRNGSLLYCLADGKVYLVSGNQVRHVKSPEIMAGLGLRLVDAVYVSLDEINLHERGAPLV